MRLQLILNQHDAGMPAASSSSRSPPSARSPRTPRAPAHPTAAVKPAPTVNDDWSMSELPTADDVGSPADDSYEVGPHGYRLRPYRDGTNMLDADLDGPTPHDPLFTYVVNPQMTDVVQRRDNAVFLHRHNEFFIPIFRLPDELLSYCFELAVDYLEKEAEFTSLLENRMQSMVAREPWQNFLFVRIMRAVCKRWNRTALATPRLWRYMVFPRVKEQFERLFAFHLDAECLARSGVIPVDVYLTGLQALWHTGDHALIFAPDVLPRIRRLAIQDAELAHPDSIFHLPWTAPWQSLQTLTLKKYTLQFCGFLALLRGAPQLHSMYLQQIVFNYCNDPDLEGHDCHLPRTRIVLPQLQQLHLCKYASDIATSLFGALHLPRLTHLTIVRPDPDSSMPPAMAMHAQAGATYWPLPLKDVPQGTLDQVRHLAYYGDHLMHEEILDTLRHTPGVEVLAIGAKYNPFEESELFHWMWTPDPRGQYLVPRLHTVLLQNCNMPLRTFDTLINFKHHTPGVVPLRAIGFDEDSSLVNYDNFVPSVPLQNQVNVFRWEGVEAYTP